MVRLVRVVFCGLFFLLIASAVTVQAQDGLSADVVKTLKGSTVFVKTAIGPIKMSGSGFVIHVDGNTALIATNEHVIAKPKELKVGGFVPGLRGRDRLYLNSLQRALADKAPAVSVVFNSGENGEQALDAKVVGAIEEIDLAILKVSGFAQAPKPIEYAKSPAPVETMPVYVLGFPFGDALSENSKNPTITIGKASVSSIRKGPTGKISKVQIDGSLNPGNSGGPVVDAKGNLIGIAVQTIQGSNIGFAIPSTELVETVAGRVGKPTVAVTAAVNGAPPTYEVRLPIIDPFNRLKLPSVEYVDGAVQLDPAKESQPQLVTLPGNKKSLLLISDSMATGKLDLPTSEKQGAREVTMQASVVNHDGYAVYAEPIVIKVAAPAVVTSNVTSAPGNATGNTTVTITQKSGKGTRQTTITSKQGGSSTKGKPADDDDDDDEVVEEKKPGSKTTAKKETSKGKTGSKTDSKATAKNDKSKKEEAETKAPEFGWTNKLSKMKKIPDEELTGKVDGMEFSPDKVTLSLGTLEFRQGTEFFADLSVSIVLFTGNEDLAGKRIVANGSIGGPHFRIASRKNGQQLPNTQPFLDALMVLEFGEYNAEDRTLPGKIYLCTPDKAKSYIVGTFEAALSR